MAMHASGQVQTKDMYGAFVTLAYYQEYILSFLK